VTAQPHDRRPIGVAIRRDDLVVGDHCNVSVEPRMLGDRTGAYVTYRNVVFRGEESGILVFESPVDVYEVPDWEIVRVVLVDPETGLAH